jgi:hypothetical protein
VFISDPKTLVATTLTSVNSSKTNCNKRAIAPDGREYIMDEIFPEKTLPKTVFIISAKKAYFPPRRTKQRRINTLEIPSLAPGINKGGNRLSRIKDISAIAVRIPHREILTVNLIFSPHNGLVVFFNQRTNF